MELPECHNAAIEKAAEAMCESESPCPSCRAAARDAITAYFAALKEQGLLTERTESAWNWAFPSGDIVVTYFPALIIRMEQK